VRNVDAAVLHAFWRGATAEALGVAHGTEFPTLRTVAEPPQPVSAPLLESDGCAVKVLTDVRCSGCAKRIPVFRCVRIARGKE